MEAAPRIEARHGLSPDQIEAIEDRLYDFNARRTGRGDGAALAFLAEIGGEMVGAAAGYSWGGAC